jgi:hypothetical protein
MPLFVQVHVAISLLGIVSGIVVVLGLVANRTLCRWTAFFLATTVLTSATGFLLPARHFMPSHAVGIISLVVLAAAIAARYPCRLRGAWRRIYTISAVTALYLNVFVLIVQLFLKVPALHALAPKGAEPPFAITQLANLGLFIVLGVLATLRFKAPLPGGFATPP